MADDRILLNGMRFHARHGVSVEERAEAQLFRVDLEVDLDLRRPGVSDRLEDTVDYSALFRTVRVVMEGGPRHLLEALAEEIASQVLSGFPVEAVRVRVVKLRPPIQGATLEGAAVEVYRRRGQAGRRQPGSTPP